MEKEFEVYIRNKTYSNMIEVAFVKIKNGKRFIAKPVNLEFKEIEEGVETRATMEFNLWEGKELLNAFKKELEGINLNQIEGELKATKYHLEDMRKIVYKNREVK